MVWGFETTGSLYTFVISTVVVQSKDTSDIMFLFFGMAGGGHCESRAIVFGGLWGGGGGDRQGRGLTLE